MADVGTIRAQMVLDVSKALQNFTAVRLANLQTVTALRTGGGALVVAGAGMAAVGAGMIAALLGAANAAGEFERKLDFFGAVSASTEEQMEAVRIKALELGRDTIYSADQIAESFVELGKAGVGAEDIINGIGESVANLGAAADIPLDQAANIMLSAVQTFQLAAGDAVHVADLLAGAANASIVEVEDLGVSLKYAGGTANALGIPLEDVIDALGLLGTYGIKGSTAGTSLRQTMLSLGGTTKAAKKQLADLGIIMEDGTNKFFNADGSAKSLSEVFQILQEATAGMSDQARVAAFRTIFQTRAMSTALSLTKAGAAGFDEMNAAISKTTAADVAAKRLDNLSGDIEILRGNMETLAIETGSELQKFLRGVVQGITNLVQWFSDLNPQVQKTIIWMTAILGILLVVVGTITAMSGSLLILIAAYKQMLPAIQLFLSLLKAARIAMIGFNLSMLANPIFLVIAAIVAIVAALVLFFTKTEVGRRAWAAFTSWLLGVWNAVLNFFKALPAWFSNFWNTIKTNAVTIWNNIVAFVQGIPQMLINAFLNFTLIGLLIQHWDAIWLGIQTAWNNILAFFQALPGNIANFFAELPGKVGYWIGYMIGTALRLLIEFGTNVRNTVTTMITNVITFFRELPGKIREILIRMAVWAILKFREMRDKVIETAVNLYNGVVDWIQKLPGRIQTFFKNAYQWAVEKFLEMRNKIVSTAIEIYNNVKDWIQKLPERVREFFENARKWAVEKFIELRDKAKEIAQKIFTNIRDEILKIPAKVKEIFLDAIHKITGLVGDAVNAAKDFAGGLWNGFKDALGIHSPSYIEEAMWQITDVLGTETERMKKQVRTLQGLGNGISEVGNDLGTDMESQTALMAAQMRDQIKAAQDYRNALMGIASSTSESIRGVSSTGNAGNPAVIVQAGDQTTLEVEWNAAPDDTISTRQQAVDLLGQAVTITGGNLEDK